jgi:purine-binding chemotaxis protein CheW
MHQFVTFKIDENLMGIDILGVREINRILDITPVQHGPDYVRGLINLRGQTITVFDIGVRMGLSPRKISSRSHNIILKHDGVGFLVDDIGDVIYAQESEVEPLTVKMGALNSHYIRGVVIMKNDLILVLSMKRILEYKD